MLYTVAIAPHRPNIKLSVQSTEGLEEYARELSEQLRKSKLHYPRTILFCQSYQDCVHFYLSINHYLGEDKTEPSRYPDLLEYYLTSMYTRVHNNKVSNHTESTMRKYCENKHKCRRIKLYEKFVMYEPCSYVIKCQSCHICAITCDCISCSNQLQCSK